MRRYLVAGNWKMNGSRQANSALIEKTAAGLTRCRDVEVVVCPPAVYLDSVGRALGGTAIRLGAQNLCDRDAPGAFTGEIHGAMLKELDCEYVVVGHSERRALYGETDAVVAKKFRTAQTLDLIPILCVGETLEQREAGQTETVLVRQLEAVLELCGVPSLPFAVGVYLPLATSMPIFVGGAVRWVADAWAKRSAAESEMSPGVLLSSGYIAGGAIAGIVVALFALNSKLVAALDMSGRIGEWSHCNLTSVAAFGVLVAVLTLIGAEKWSLGSKKHHG